jgi:outer membrane protein TolC
MESGIIMVSRSVIFFSLVSVLFGIVALSATRSKAADTPLPATGDLTLRDVVHTTLTQQAMIALSKEQVVQSNAVTTLTRAEFDWNLESNLSHTIDYRPTGASTLYDRILTTAYDLRLVKKTESGISFEPGVLLRRTSSDPVGSSSATDNALRVSFALVVPLLQGSGKTVVTAREAASKFEYEAARFELQQTISQSVYDATVAYWQYVAANERLKLAVAAEERADSVVVNTEVLVNADEVPQAELVNAQANQLEKKMSREHTEMALLGVKLNIGQLMGIAPEKSADLPLPTGIFPVVSSSLAQNALNNRHQILDGAYRRGDLRALMQKSKASESVVVATKDALDPKLDLVSAIGYDGYQTGLSLQKSLQTVENRQRNPDWSVGLRFSFPLGNSTARGNYAIASSQQAQNVIRVHELHRTVESALRMIVLSLQNVARETETADRTVASYQRAVNNEKEKHLMGESTLLDLLYTQDKLESAQVARTDIYLSGALLLTKLQFESGTLLACSGDTCDFNPDAAALLVAIQKEAN